jgi:hypothetical protein
MTRVFLEGFAVAALTVRMGLAVYRYRGADGRGAVDRRQQVEPDFQEGAR